MNSAPEPMTTPAPLPAGAVTAAAEAIHRATCEYDLADCIEDGNHDQAARDALEAARPRLVAAERQRIIETSSSDAPETERLGLFRLAATDGALRERERCAQLAEDLKFTLWRPGNGPGAGEQALDVVPLAELLTAISQGAEGGGT